MPSNAALSPRLICLVRGLRRVAGGAVRSQASATRAAWHLFVESWDQSDITTPQEYVSQRMELMRQTGVKFSYTNLRVVHKQRN